MELKLLTVLISCFHVTSVTIAEDTEPYLIRTVNKNGLHRDLVTRIIIPKAMLKGKKGCSCLVKEFLPSGAYADYFELCSMKDLQVIIPTKVDTEKPEYLSEPMELSVYTPELHRQGDAMVTNVTLPIHIRYHAPRDTKHRMADITLKNPEIFIHCESGYICTEAVCKTKDMACSGDDGESCTWNSLSFKSGADQIVLRFPVGNTDHVFPVLILTFTSVIGSIIIICRDLLAYSKVYSQ